MESSAFVFVEQHRIGTREKGLVKTVVGRTKKELTAVNPLRLDKQRRVLKLMAFKNVLDPGLNVNNIG